MIHAYLFLALLIPLTFLFAASAIFWTLLDKSGKSYAFHARLWARIVLTLAGVRVDIRGSENIPDGPVILMSNHQSGFDILSLLAAMPRRFYWIAKKELFDIPVFGPSMRRGGYIPLDRSDGRKALKSMENAAAIIRQGSSVVMFPGRDPFPGRAVAAVQAGRFHAGASRPVSRSCRSPSTAAAGSIPAGQIRLYRGRHHHYPPSAGSTPRRDCKKSAAEEWLMEKVREAIAISGLEI